MLENTFEWSMRKCQYLSRIVDLSAIQEFWWISENIEHNDLNSIRSLFRRLCNIKTLVILSADSSVFIVNCMWSEIGRKVRYFQVTLNTLKKMRQIIKHGVVLSSVKFIDRNEFPNVRTSMIAWLKKKKRIFSWKEDSDSFTLDFF